MNVRELIAKALSFYELALEHLENKDYMDACEKAWACIETLRKALLVKTKVSYEKAKTIVYGVPLFTRLLKKLGRQDLLEKYTFFNYKLHVMGFYEGITEPWEIEEIIRVDLKKWINEMIKLIESINVDLSTAESLLVEIEKIKRRLLIENAKLIELRSQLDTLLDKIIKT